LKKITEERKSLLVCLVRQVGLLVEPVETNILIFSLAPHCNDQALIEKLKQKNISISSMGPGNLE
jgi:hypothetical protein